MGKGPRGTGSLSPAWAHRHSRRGTLTETGRSRGLVTQQRALAAGGHALGWPGPGSTSAACRGGQRAAPCGGARQPRTPTAGVPGSRRTAPGQSLGRELPNPRWLSLQTGPGKVTWPPRRGDGDRTDCMFGKNGSGQGGARTRLPAVLARKSASLPSARRNRHKEVLIFRKPLRGHQEFT